MEKAVIRAEELLKKKLKVDHVDPDKELKSLGLDSLDLVELCLEFEDEFGISFTSEELKELKKVSDVYDVIENKINKK